MLRVRALIVVLLSVSSECLFTGIERFLNCKIKALNKGTMLCFALLLTSEDLKTDIKNSILIFFLPICNFSTYIVEPLTSDPISYIRDQAMVRTQKVIVREENKPLLQVVQQYKYNYIIRKTCV